MDNDFKALVYFTRRMKEEYEKDSKKAEGTAKLMTRAMAIALDGILDHADHLAKFHKIEL